MNKLESLRTVTEVVADTGDIQAIAKYQPQDATTNPSLILKAAQMPQYQQLVAQCIERANFSDPSNQQQLSQCMDWLVVLIAKEIVRLVPGRVSLEVDARLSFDTEGTIAKAQRLIALLESEGIGKDRVLIKIASTWEGIRAAKTLEQQGIQCNLTLLFGFAQAVACAQANVFLISPFVGRILDWHKKNSGRESYPPQEDPGVLSVKTIYRYYKAHNYKTIVMGASFRSLGEIEQLAGCDKLTISPELLQSLLDSQGSLEPQLTPKNVSEVKDKVHMTEAKFRWRMNQDAMATEKLAEGIRNFAKDQGLLESYLQQLVLQGDDVIGEESVSQ